MTTTVQDRSLPQGAELAPGGAGGPQRRGIG